jgi:GLPGLI family protein
MRLFYLILIIASFYSIQSIAQNKTTDIEIIDHTKYFATYSYEYQRDSTSKDSRRQATMYLLIGNNKSQFEHSSNFVFDSIFVNNNSKNRINLIINQISGDPMPFFAQYAIFKNKIGKQVETYERISGNYYRITEELDFKWQALNKKDTLIAGYRCKEAQTFFRGRKYRAWYTLEIPINDGPYKFKGLPGLIIKLEDRKKEHSFELEYFEKINYNKPIYFRTKNYVNIDSKDYKKLKQNEVLERTNRIRTQTIDISSQDLNSTEAKMLTRNNFIEK